MCHPPTCLLLLLSHFHAASHHHREKLFEKLIDGEYNDNDPVHVRKVQQLLQEERKQRKELQRLRKIVSSLEQQYESMKDTVNPSFANNNNHHDPIESTTTQDF